MAQDRMKRINKRYLKKNGAVDIVTIIALTLVLSLPHILQYFILP